MTLKTISKNNLTIRLTEERWSHITEGHSELAEMQAAVLETVSEPERILQGNDGEQIAVKEIQLGKWLAVFYRENEEEGFIITAFLTRRQRSLDRRKQLWP